MFPPSGGWAIAAVFAVAIAGAEAAPSNAVTITDLSGRGGPARPFTISRFFAQGEIPQFARARVNGRPVFTQCDVKTRWADGSVQHALISFFAAVDAYGSATVDFISQATGNNDGPLNQKEMLQFDPGTGPGTWGARIEAVASGVAASVDARAMMSDRSWRYWLRGPICTQVIVEGFRESEATAFAYDFGWQREGDLWRATADATYNSLHPIFVLTFYRGRRGLKIEFVLENAWTAKLQDQAYSLTLSTGNPVSTVLYSKAGFTHIARSRWRKMFWTGTNPGPVNIDYNLPYLIHSRVVPSYDLTKVVSAEAIRHEVTAFRDSDRGDLGGHSQWQTYFPAAGGRPDIGLFPRWYVRYLFTFDPELYGVMLGNAATSGHIPIHLREGRRGRPYTDLATVDAVGRPLSIDARPTFRSTNQSQDTRREDLIWPVGAVSTGRWTVDLAHQPSLVFIPYLITGDWYFLEELYFWAAYNLAAGNPGTTLNYHRHAGWGFLGDDLEIRGVAWGLRNLAHAALAAPDGSLEKAYFQQKLNNNIAVREGKYNITDGAFCSRCSTNPYVPDSETSKWCWGRYTTAGGRRNPLCFLTEGNRNETEGLDAGRIYAGASPWMFNYWHIVLGHLKELGFSVGKLQEATAKNLLHQILDPNYNPRLTATYRIPVRGQPGLEFLDTWAAVKTGYQEPLPVNFSEKDQQDVEHGYRHIARAATSFLPGIADGVLRGIDAWQWMTANVGGQDLLNDNPKWALEPRVGDGERLARIAERWDRMRVQQARRAAQARVARPGGKR